MAYIYGRNPVLEALQAGKPIQKIYIQHGNQSGKIRQIYHLARQEKIAVTNADSKKLRQMVGDSIHQGIVALISPVRILAFDELLGTLSQQFKATKKRQEPNRISSLSLVIADRIQDPHNMGAIIRSAEVFGAQGVIFSTRETVPITETVVKASAGAALHCPLYRADNLGQAIDRLKKTNFWIYGAALDTDALIWEVDFNRHCAIIIGSEEKGIRPSLQKKCDQLFKIPQFGKTQSLNASVAAGIVLSEMKRQQANQR